MNYENFLTDAYFGFFDKKIFNRFQDIQPDEITDNIIHQYLKVFEEYPPLELDKLGLLPDELLEKLKRIQFFGLNIPRDYDGAGLSLLQYLKVVEAVASTSLSLGITALAHLSIGVKGIVLFGNEAQKRKYLRPAATGDMIFSYALTEPRTGSDAQHIETSASRSEDGRFYILNGQKTYITNANFADAMTVFAQMDPARPGFMGAFIVETAWDGVTVGEEMPKMGLKASSTAGVQFKNVKVPQENLLGRPGGGFKIAMTILNYGRMALAATSSGMLKESLDDMVKRAAARKQFGVPINQFELIQEKMVKARVDSYVVSAITAFTAGMLNDDPLAPVTIESSHSKLFGTTRAWNTLYEALQVAGGSGYLSTQPYELRMRDFRVTTIFEGTTEIHSIYPALFMIRKLTKRMEKVGSGKLSNMLFLIKRLFQKTNWNLKFENKDMNRAAKACRSLAGNIRFLIIAGLFFYGEAVLQKQFFLRRISNLSLYFFSILAILARIESKLNSGHSVGSDLEILNYFTEETLQYKKINRKFRPQKKELFHKKIFKEIMVTR